MTESIMARARLASFRAPLLVALFAAAVAHASGEMPPWSDPDDLPLPPWAKSVVSKKNDQQLIAGPSGKDPPRGSIFLGTRAPLFGAKRGPGCGGRWLLVGPLAWICSDAATLSADDPLAMPSRRSDDGLPYRYYFVGKDGASGFSDLARVQDDAPEKDLEPGFAVAANEQRTADGERWVHTHAGYWIAERELGEARSSSFHGDATPAGSLDVAWVVADRASVWPAPGSGGRPSGSRVRFDAVHWHEERAAPGGVLLRVSDDGATPSEWMRAKDVARPLLSTPPDEIGGASTAERWVDVEIASQTLVAYEGARPVYATLVSTGRGAPGSDTLTPPGAHRIWVKLLSTNMDNLENDEAEQHYSIEDVPYVQFFDKTVAVHGAFWHHDFGRAHSHGCVNLAPIDATWLFGWTSPHLPAGWSAVMPMRYEKGTMVRVR
jgi:lipoprotein-anchoring transpeptidase ErfK/SrfK